MLICKIDSLPIRLTLGPREHQNLFSEFFDNMEKFTPHFKVIEYLILSDKGLAIKSFCNKCNFNQLF